MPRQSPSFSEAHLSQPPLVQTPRRCRSQVLLARVIAAASDLGALWPALAPCRILAYRDSLPRGLVGAYSLVVLDDRPLYVGLVFDKPSSVELARAASADDCPSRLRPSEVRTALCEILGEVVRGTDRGEGQWLGHGPALFINGIPRTSQGVRMRAAEIVLGSIRATLVLVMPNAQDAADRLRSPAGREGGAVPPASVGATSVVQDPGERGAASTHAQLVDRTALEDLFVAADRELLRAAVAAATVGASVAVKAQVGSGVELDVRLAPTPRPETLASERPSARRSVPARSDDEHREHSTQLRDPKALG